MHRYALALLVCSLLLFMPGGLAGAGDVEPPDAPEGHQQGPVKRFGPENLFEHINGQAEAFIRFGFTSLTSVVYSDPSGDNRITLDIYEMTSPLAASGPYLGLGADLDDRLGAGRPSTSDDYSAACLKGRHYLTASSGKPFPAGSTTLPRLILKAAEKLPDAPRPEELSWLPEKNRLPGTLRYTVDGVLRTSELPRGLSARYDLNGAETDIGLAFLNTPDEAKSAFQDAARKIGQLAGAKDTPAGLPDGWLAFPHRYRGNMLLARNGRFVVLAYRVKNTAETAAFIRPWFESLPGGSEKP